MVILVLGCLAFLVAFGLSRWLIRPGSILFIVDQPVERSLHEHPTPRMGGIAILAALLVVWGLVGLASLAGSLGAPLWTPVPLLWEPAPLVGFCLIALVSLWDDVRGLTQWPRLAAHGLAAVLLLAGGGAVDSLGLPGGWSVPLGVWGAVPTLLFVIWFANLYNFMDGMDGFAGGMGVIGFSSLALLGWMNGHHPLAWTALFIAVSNLGFLTMNFPPARIFMGDAGAVSMGFAAAALSLWGRRDGVFPLWVPVLIFSPFIVDATVTLVRRAIKGEKVWRAHRSHYYQRLVLLGWGHRNTVLAEYGLMLAVGTSAVMLSSRAHDRIAVVGVAVWGIVYLGIAWWIDRAHRNAVEHRRETTT